jgi:hypothetical protein
MTNLWPVASMIANLVLALLLYSLRSTIRIAILELKESLSEKYATKEYVDERVNLAQKLDTGFANVHKLFDRNRVVQPGEGANGR